MKKKIAITADHGGYGLKSKIIETFSDYDWIDLGTNTNKERSDYPDFIPKVAEVIKGEEADLAITVCGTGIGFSIGLNRFHHIFAAVCTDTTMARLTREHNNANVLALGERLVGYEVAMDIVKTFLETKFLEKDRYVRRIEKLKDIAK